MTNGTWTIVGRLTFKELRLNIHIIRPPNAADAGYRTAVRVHINWHVSQPQRTAVNLHRLSIEHLLIDVNEHYGEMISDVSLRRLLRYSAQT